MLRHRSFKTVFIIHEIEIRIAYVYKQSDHVPDVGNAIADKLSLRYSMGILV